MPKQSPLPPTDMITASLAMAVCDLLVIERAKLNAAFNVLERKGLLSPAEMRETIQSIDSLSAESAEADWHKLQQKLQERMAVHFQELMLHFGPTGTT
jgi:hypothetical protein